MKCPACQSESPEGKAFCSDCGSALSQPQQLPEDDPIVAVSTARKPDWLSAHSKALAAFVIVSVVMLASVGLIYTQPLSKLKVIVSSEYDGSLITVKVYIDNELKVGWDVGGGMTIVGVWSVDAGKHAITLDHGTWQVSYSGTIPSFSNYIDPDGTMDFSRNYTVGPLTTKDVYIYIVLPE